MNEETLQKIIKFRKMLNHIYDKKINYCRVKLFLTENDFDKNTNKYRKFLNLEIKIFTVLKKITYGYELLSESEKNNVIKEYNTLIFKIIDDCLILSVIFNEEVYLEQIGYYKSVYDTNKGFDIEKDLNKKYFSDYKYF